MCMNRDKTIEYESPVDRTPIEDFVEALAVVVPYFVAMTLLVLALLYVLFRPF